MIDKNDAEPGTPDPAAESAAPAVESSPGDAVDDKAPPLDLEAEIAVLEDRITELEAEAEAERDRALRARADADNTAKRAGRERADAVKYGASALARDLLEIVDNLERALASMPADGETKVEDVRTLREGVELTLQELIAKFRRHDIQRIAPATGDGFDPNHHQAVAQVERDDVAGGAVVDLLQPGYRHHDRLLRAAVVTTNRKDAKNTKEAEEAEETSAAGAPPAPDDADAQSSSPGKSPAKSPASGSTDSAPDDSQSDV